MNLFKLYGGYQIAACGYEFYQHEKINSYPQVEI